jgi:hypothetical protein
VTTGRWHPDPSAFLDRRLSEQGRSVQQFLADRPGLWWGKLAREFDEPLATVQLMAYAQEAAAKGRWLDWFARDALARTLHRWLPSGWHYKNDVDAETADAFSDWITTMGALGQSSRDMARAVVETLKQSHLPLGWLPNGPDDPLLARAFEGVTFD